MGPCLVSIFQYISNKMQRYTIYLYLESVLHVSGGTSTHHQERIQLYLQHLVFVTTLLLSAAISWNRFECAVGGVKHPQHTVIGKFRLWRWGPLVLKTGWCVYVFGNVTAGPLMSSWPRWRIQPKSVHSGINRVIKCRSYSSMVEHRVHPCPVKTIVSKQQRIGHDTQKDREAIRRRRILWYWGKRWYFQG
jgi:hypothetical protein